MFKFTTHTLIAVAAITASGDTALHFQVQAYDPTTGTWRAYKSDTALQSVHTNGGGGWVLAQRPAGSKVVYFDQTSEGVASPLQFPPDSTNTIRQITALVLCEESAGLSTFVSADCPVRYTAYPADVPFNPPDPMEARELPEEFRGHGVEISVNARETNILKPDLARLQLLEFTFDEGVAANRVFVGGNAANPMWRRNWRGGIVEMIAFNEVLGAREANAVRRLMSAKYGLRLRTDADDDIVGILTRLGVDESGLFGTLIMIR